jgi:hypothetical protein
MPVTAHSAAEEILVCGNLWLFLILKRTEDLPAGNRLPESAQCFLLIRWKCGGKGASPSSLVFN